MCPRHHVDFDNRHLDFETFRQIVNTLDGTKEISLVGLGEPFTHPQIYEAIRYCKAKGLKVKTTTNGLLLNNNEKLKLLVNSGLDSISFSIEKIGPHDNPDDKIHPNVKAIEHVKNLISLKKQLNSLSPKIILQAVLVRNREKDIYDLIAWGARNGVDRINVIRMTTYFETGLERPSEAEEEIIFKHLARLRRKYKIRIDCVQDQFFTGVAGFLYKNFKYMLRTDSFCQRLLDYPYITVNGDMIPCCVLPGYSFGNVLKEDIHTIWKGQKIKKFRKNHQNISICSRCDNFRLKQVV